MERRSEVEPHVPMHEVVKQALKTVDERLSATEEPRSAVRVPDHVQNWKRVEAVHCAVLQEDRDRLPRDRKYKIVEARETHIRHRAQGSENPLRNGVFDVKHVSVVPNREIQRRNVDALFHRGAAHVVQHLLHNVVHSSLS